VYSPSVPGGQPRLPATKEVREEVKSFGLTLEGTWDKNDWRLGINGINGLLPGKWPLKTVCVINCVIMQCLICSLSPSVF